MRGRSRDDDGFAVFVAARWQHLVALAALIAGDRFAAEDAVQAALARVWVKWPGIAEEARFGYVRRAVVNEVLGRGRSAAARETPFDSLPEPLGRDPMLAVAEADLVRSALATLPARARAVVVLRHLEDLTVAEVAFLLKISPGSVKSMNSRALTRLRVSLESEGELR